MRALIVFVPLAIIVGLWSAPGTLGTEEEGKIENDRRKRAEKQLVEIERRVENEPWAVRSRAAINALLLEVAKAEKVEIFRLSPKEVGKGGAKRTFHGHEIVGEVRAITGEERKVAGDFLAKALHWDTAYRQGACFTPKHGVRATVAGKPLDLVISFDCWRAKAFDGEEARASFALVDVAPNVLDKLLPPMDPAPKGNP
jgi:hypothetical protein